LKIVSTWGMKVYALGVVREVGKERLSKLLVEQSTNFGSRAPNGVSTSEHHAIK
jgi:hypothetical protein